MNKTDSIIDVTKLEQIERGKRIKYIRENELNMSKIKLAEAIGVSGQFLGLVEDGKGNLVYRSLKKLRDLSGHSADYILYGFDDTIIDKTKVLLQKYDETQLVNGLKVINEMIKFIKD